MLPQFCFSTFYFKQSGYIIFCIVLCSFDQAASTSNAKEEAEKGLADMDLENVDIEVAGLEFAVPTSSIA